ncbi:hypothetical protein DS691_21360 [Salmonella enterica subsp. enterica serovar Bareilly]|nr:hypothetical protein [Salmonella enterica subsp. enterica serovar Bareilly]
MTLQLFVISHILVGLITALYFKFVVVDKLSKNKIDKIEKFINDKSNYQTKAFIEVYCNQTQSGFFLKFATFLLFMCGILAPVGFYKLNKELGEI